MSTTPITFDDLHESEQQLLVREVSADQPGFFDPAWRATRREQVREYDTHIAPALRTAWRRVITTPWYLSWLPSVRRSRLDLQRFAFVVLEKIQAEDGTGLEQFGPVKRAVVGDFYAR